MPFSVPASAKPFTLSVSDENLAEFRQLLRLSKLAPVTWESLQEDGRFGITHKWITASRHYWLNNYDWRTQEKHINSFPNYTMEIEGVDVHFIGLFSDKVDAAPIVLMHGWPGSFIEFLPMAELVQSKYKSADQPYHFIIASLPGYPLSEGLPTDRDWKMEDSARLIDRLMTNLGFEKYIAQGGDVGSFVAGLLSKNYDRCIGSHQNMIRAPHPAFVNMNSYEQNAVLRTTEWRKTGVAYAIEQATRPSTIGYVLSSNPLAELAWIGEKFLEWSDQDPPLDDILTNVSLYWFTQAYPRSLHPYRAIFNFLAEDQPYLSKPTGYSWFAYELSPGIKAGVEKVCNLVTYKEHERGGHFAALECPKELLEDLEDYVQTVWKC